MLRAYLFSKKKLTWIVSDGDSVLSSSFESANDVDFSWGSYNFAFGPFSTHEGDPSSQHPCRSAGD